MKKGKKLVSKVGTGGFSTNKKEINIEEVFAGYPPASPAYGENEDVEADSLAEMEWVLAWLKHSDTHPPKIDNIHGRNNYFCIVFESREQKDEFLHECDLYRIGDKYLEGEIFADAFGIDLATGTIKKRKQNGMAFGKSSLSFGSTLSFDGKSQLNLSNAKKKEISEHLKKVREDEKNLAKYMAWCSEAEYWLALAFRNEKEKENCLKALGLELEYDGKYLWCHDVAKALGVELVPCTFKNKNEYTGHDARIESMIYYKNQELE